MQNRRAHARIQVHLNAEIRQGDREFTATTRDLSEGGACIESAYKLAEGSHVALALFLVVDGIEDHATAALETRASVQWTAQNDDAPTTARHMAGLKFDAISEAQRAWLTDLLARAAG